MKQLFFLIALIGMLNFDLIAQSRNIQLPVNPNASQEAVDLLRYLYSISGKKTLSGMHNVIGRMSEKSDRIHNLTSKYPAIWGGDFGFADSTHDIDNIKYRPLLVPEIKKQYQKGSIIVLTYHQSNPLMGDPVPFKGGVISELTDDQWKELLTPGTPLYEKWCIQMDLLASYLVQLKDAHIPVIFRPYHEMNGSWFWWGGRKGKDGFIALWKQLFDYYTKHYQLNNILWAWTPDKPKEGVEEFFPGSNTVDILGCDIYPVKGNKEVYPQEWYDRMKKLADGKPLALTENSVLMNLEQLEKQPWVWFMSWGDMVFNENPDELIKKLYHSKRIITRDELPHWQTTHPDK